MRRRHIEKALNVLIHGEVGEVSAKHRAAASKAHSRSKRWRQSAGIQGFGIGQRMTEGKKRRDLVLKVYVASKRPRHEIEHPVPRTISITGIEGRIRTDVEEIGVLRLQAAGDRERPAHPGVGLSHPQAASGTFGCLVRRNGSPDLYILSNSHVIANSGLGHRGDPIHQPSAQYGGGPGDVIAVLEDSVRLIFSDAGYPNLVDAAIAKVLNPADVEPTLKSIGVPRGVSTKIEEGMSVQMTGSVSGHVTGVVKNPDFVAELWYENTEGGASRVGFRKQVLCEPFTVDGDSGALVLNMEGEAVGIHFAGSDLVSIFNPISFVLDVLKIELAV
jgi:hypothetical protein